MPTTTSTPQTNTYFENAIGRLSIHLVDQHITIDYYRLPRRGAALQDFLTQAGNLLVHGGWEKLVAAQAAMPDFTAEELAEVCAYWRTHVAQHPAILHGALLLPHTVFTCLSWQVR